MKDKLLNVTSKTTKYLDPHLQLNIFPERSQAWYLERGSISTSW